MTRNKSRKRNLMKYLPFLPILLLAILVFSKHDGRVQVEKAMASLMQGEKQPFDEREITDILKEMASTYATFTAEDMKDDGRFINFATDYKNLMKTYYSSEREIADLTKAIFLQYNILVEPSIDALTKVARISFLNSKGTGGKFTLFFDDDFDILDKDLQSIENRLYKLANTYQKFGCCNANPEAPHEHFSIDYQTFLSNFINAEQKLQVAKLTEEIFKEQQISVDLTIADADGNKNWILEEISFKAEDVHRGGEAREFTIYVNDDIEHTDTWEVTFTQFMKLYLQKHETASSDEERKTAMDAIQIELNRWIELYPHREEEIRSIHSELSLKSLMSKVDFLQKPQQNGKTPFVHPIKDQSKITRETGYGMRMHPIFKKRQLHTGVDYVVPMNTEIVATADGKILTAKNWSKGYGVHITIEHVDGYSTFYAHLEKLLVKEGQQVKQGEVIALSGTTGISTGPHLHYEVRKNGEAIDFEKEDLGMNTANPANTLARFASNYLAYDPKAIESSFEAVFHNPNFTLEDRNIMLSEDYRLFIARHKEKKTEIENTLRRVVLMKGFSLEILEQKEVFLYKKDITDTDLDVDEMPRFPSKDCEVLKSEETKRKCSNTELIKYIYSNIKYPKAARIAGTEGQCLIRFKVMQNGSLENIRLLKDIGHGCGEEAKRVIEKINTDNIRWIPGKKDGKNVAVEFTIPVNFKLQDAQKDETSVQSQQEEIFKVVEQMPRFPSEECEQEQKEEKGKCSYEALMQYLFKNIKYPKTAKEAGVEGMCVIQFVVEKDGSLSELKLLKDQGYGLGEEAKRVVEKMNEDGIRWIPGLQRGRTVRVQSILPIKFKLTDDRKEENTTEKFDPTPQIASQKLALSAFNIAPNPSKGGLRLRFEGAAKSLTIKVYDANGKTLFEEQVHNFDGHYNKQIEVKSSTGIHFLTIEQEGKIFVEQIMIE